MEQFFGEIGKKVPGYEEFEKKGGISRSVTLVSF